MVDAVETFGERLRRVRKAARVSAYALAKAVGVTEAAIRAWEGGRCSGPSLVVGLRIAKALCEDPDFLAFGTETPHTDADTLAAQVAALDARCAAMEAQR